MKFVKTLLLILTVLIVLGCTQMPRYQTLYRYEPPTDPAALSCLQGCEESLASCHVDCKQEYANCIQAIELEASAKFAAAQKRYEGAWTQYLSDVDSYRLNLSLGWSNSGEWYGQGWHDPLWPGGYRPNHYRPQPPSPPRYEDELGKLVTLNCNRDCGCQPVYDSCFLGCGGKKIPEQRCMVNCPVEK